MDNIIKEWIELYQNSDIQLSNYDFARYSY